MRAVVITQPGGPEVLTVQDVPTPRPGAEQVLVRIRAAGLNRADILQRVGHYPAPPGSPSNIPGLEFAGEVAELGAGVTAVQPGQRVYGICGGGGYAEYIVAHERMLVPVPDSLDIIAAGGVPEVFMTVHDGLFTQANLAMAESMLVHAVGSGIGTAAIQLAKAAGCPTLGTSRTPDKLERARELGLDIGLPAEGWQKAARAATDGQGVNVILDSVGGAYVAADLAALATLGRIVLLSTMAGTQDAVPLNLLVGKRARLFGTVLRARPLEEKIAVTRAFARHVNPLLASGRVRPIIDRVFNLDDVVEAHSYLESNASFGKVVLSVP
jgi:NADPH:quinone reductase